MRNLLFFLLNVVFMTQSNNIFSICDVPESIPIYSGDLISMKGPQKELQVYNHFPKIFYQVCAVKGVGSFYVDSRVDIIKNKLREGIPWETEIIDLINEHARKNSTVIDIGSHIGTHTVAMSKRVGSSGKVIAFEPQIKLFSELIMNMELNGCKNATCYRCAVGNRFDLVEMNPSVVDNEGGTGIGTGGDKAYMITVDSLNLKNVSLMKIDVENAEMDVLKGARNTIISSQPVIIIEIMGNTYQPIKNRSQKVEEVLQYIQLMGYDLSYIKGSWSDWLAIPKKKHTNNN